MLLITPLRHPSTFAKASADKSGGTSPILGEDYCTNNLLYLSSILSNGGYYHQRVILTTHNIYFMLFGHPCQGKVEKVMGGNG